MKWLMWCLFFYRLGGKEDWRNSRVADRPRRPRELYSGWRVTGQMLRLVGRRLESWQLRQEGPKNGVSQTALRD